ncbi:MAG: coproporphyrinogen dehydrogenase HemZ [Bacillota bacterium]
MSNSSKKLRVRLELIPQDYFASVKGLFNLLLPQLEIVKSGMAEIVIRCQAELNNKELKVKTELISSDSKLTLQEVDTILQDIRYEKEDCKRRAKNKVKLQIYQLLVDELELTPSSWGILVGMRPTKLVHILLAKDFTVPEIRRKLKLEYGVAEDKIALLIQIVNKERRLLPAINEEQPGVNIYLGIPFCPSRCAYCSFPAYSLQHKEEYLADFLTALEYEIKELGKWIQQENIRVDTIYLGGGTPTILTIEQLTRVMNLIRDHLKQEQMLEFSVEAGRPDTLTRNKLKLLADHQVDRISINPQTMNQATLDFVGRNHTVDEVKEAFHMARAVGFKNINMDLIIGLPGEDVADFKSTIAEIEELAPDSLTVHTLSLKRNAQWNQQEVELELPSRATVKEMLDLSHQAAKRLGMEPYYMYRQKYMVGNLENIGYAQPGLESIYNMIMIEEQSTVIGLGGGAITKLVQPEDWQLTRLANPKGPNEYIRELEQKTADKLEELTSLIR